MYGLIGLIGFIDMDLWRFLDRMDRLVACGYIDVLHFTRIKRISLKCNSRVVKRKIQQRARESHKKVLLEEVEEDE